MKLTEAKSILTNNGYEVEERTVNKNGYSVDALSVGSGSIRPSIYEKTVENIEDEDELLSFVNRIVDNAPAVDLSVVQDKNYILKHCRSCIRHESDDESIVKWSVWDDLEEYIRLDFGSEHGSNMSCIVTKALMSTLDIDADELREHARRNLREHVSIKSMAQVLTELMGQVPSEIGSMDEMMYVACTDDKSYGASVMLLEDVLQDFITKYGFNKITIIPSSVNEIIILGETQNTDESIINSMIESVNEEIVDEWQRLSNHLYIYSAAA